MTLSRYYARAGADKSLIKHVTEELRQSWDPDGEFSAPDGEQDAEAHALAILGILATGADLSRVKGYLRRAEESALGAARTTAEERGALAEKLWRLMLDAAIRNYKADPTAD